MATGTIGLSRVTSSDWLTLRPNDLNSYKIRKDGKGIPQAIETSSLTEQGWKEKTLENYLRENLAHLISDDLMVISQSRPFQPEADLLALDQNADLWFFELKKVATNCQNLLQVMRYSQDAASLTVDDFDEFYSKYKKGKCDCLVVDFCEHFGFCSPTAAQQWSDKIGKVHHLVVIAEGTDEDTVQSVGHWQRHGLDIQLWPFRIHPGDKTAFHFELPDLFIKGRQISKNSSGIFLLNTNRKYQPDAEKFMLEKECAFANGDKWAPRINHIETGSKVLLYANKIGIIAVGIGTAEKHNIPWDNGPGRFVKLREFRKLKSPLTAASIRKIAGKKFPLLQTLITLPEQAGEKIWKDCIDQT